MAVWPLLLVLGVAWCYWAAGRWWTQGCVFAIRRALSRKVGALKLWYETDKTLAIEWSWGKLQVVRIRLTDPRITTVPLGLTCQSIRVQLPVLTTPRGAPTALKTSLWTTFAPVVAAFLQRINFTLAISEGIWCDLEFTPYAGPDRKRRPVSNDFVEVDNHYRVWRGQLTCQGPVKAKWAYRGDFMVGAAALTASSGDTSLQVRQLAATGQGDAVSLRCDAATAEVTVTDATETMMAYLRFLMEKGKTLTRQPFDQSPRWKRWTFFVGAPVRVSVRDDALPSSVRLQCSMGGALNVRHIVPCSSCANNWDPVKHPQLEYEWAFEMSELTLDGEANPEFAGDQLPELLQSMHRLGVATGPVRLIHIPNIAKVEYTYGTWHQRVNGTRYRQTMIVEVLGKTEIHACHLASGLDLYLWYLLLNQLYKCYRLNKLDFEDRVAYYDRSQTRSNENLERVPEDSVRSGDTAKWFNNERARQVLDTWTNTLSSWNVLRLFTNSIIAVNLESIDLHTALLESPDVLRSDEADAMTLTNVNIILTDLLRGVGIKADSLTQPRRAVTATDLLYFIPYDYSRAELVVDDLSLQLTQQGDDSVLWLASVVWSYMLMIFGNQWYKDNNEAFINCAQRGGLLQNMSLVINHMTVDQERHVRWRVEGLHFIKDKVDNSIYVRVDRIWLKRLESSPHELPFIVGSSCQLWYGTSRQMALEASDLETKKLAIWCQCVEVVAAQLTDTVMQMMECLEYLLSVCNVFGQPHNAVLQCFSMVSKRTRPVTVAVECIEYFIESIVVKKSRPPQLQRCKSCPHLKKTISRLGTVGSTASVRDHRAGLISVIQTALDIDVVDDVVEALVGVVDRLLSSVKMPHPAKFKPGRGIRSSVQRGPQGLAPSVFDLIIRVSALTLRTNWHVAMPILASVHAKTGPASAELYGGLNDVQADCISYELDAHTNQSNVAATQLRVNVRNLECVNRELLSAIVTAVLTLFKRIANIRPSKVTARSLTQERFKAPTKYLALIDGYEARGNPGPPYVTLLLKETTTLSIYQHAVLLTSPELLKVSYGEELVVCAYGLVTLRVYGTSVMKLREPFEVCMYPDRRVRLLGRSVELYPYPSVLAVLFTVGRQLQSMCARVASNDSSGGGGWRLQEVTIDQTVIRLNSYASISFREMQILELERCRVRYIRALQQVSDPLCSNLACLHCNLSEINGVWTEEDGLTLEIESCSAHLTPSLIPSSVHNLTLAYCYFLHRLLQRIPSSGDLTVVARPETKIVLKSGFSLHLQETAFLTSTKGASGTPSGGVTVRKWVRKENGYDISKSLNVICAGEGDNGLLGLESHHLNVLMLLERDFISVKPWQRSSPFQSSPGGFILEGNELRFESKGSPERVTTLEVPELLLRSSRRSSDSIGRLNVNVVSTGTLLTVSIDKFLAAFTKRQTARANSLIRSVYSMLQSFSMYVPHSPFDSTHMSSSTAHSDPWVVHSRDEDVIPISDFVWEPVRAETATEMLSNKPSSVDSHSHTINGALSSLPDSATNSSVKFTLAQGSISFMSDEIQLLRVFVNGMQMTQIKSELSAEIPHVASGLRRSLGENEIEGAINDATESKVFTQVVVNDLMVITCSPHTSTDGTMTPILAPLGSDMPAISIASVHKVRQVPKRVKTSIYGRKRKKFISTLIGRPTTFFATETQPRLDDRCVYAKPMFRHIDTLMWQSNFEMNSIYDKIDVYVAPVELRLAQKLLVEIHAYFTAGSDTGSAEDEAGQSTANSDLLESLKAVEQKLLEEQQQREDEKAHDENPQNICQAQSGHHAAGSVSVKSICVHNLNMILTYYGMLSIKDCEVTLNTITLTQIETDSILTAFNKIGYQIMTSAIAKALSFRVKNMVPRRKKSERTSKRDRFAISRLMMKRSSADDMLACILDEQNKRKTKRDDFSHVR